MKMVRGVTLTAISLFAVIYSWSAASSSDIFKFHMHQIYDNYKNAKISFDLRKFEIADIHLKYLMESIASAKKHMPDKNRDGTQLDKGLFTKRMDLLYKEASSLQFINEVKYRDPLLTEFLSKDIANICVTCHTDVKKDPLFKLPRRTPLFGEYMHKVAGNLDLALAMSEDESLSGKAQEHIQLVKYYLDLLQPILPESGPSGASMDRELLKKQLAEIEEDLGEEDRTLSTADIKKSIKSVSNLCASCHNQAN